MSAAAAPLPTRDAFRGPATNNWDLSFFKNVRIKERYAVQLRWEMYNAFNHGQFGQITAARNPRIQQLALRFSS